MSLPRRIAPYFSSPSKASIFKARGGNRVPPLSRGLLPSHHSEEILPRSPNRSASTPHLEYEEAMEEGGESTEIQNSTLRPFFTLIEDTVSSEHHHPTVHYIFADDDSDIITEAACRALMQDDPSMASSDHPRAEGEQDQEESKLPPLAEAVREHYILLDVAPDYGTPGLG